MKPVKGVIWKRADSALRHRRCRVCFVRIELKTFTKGGGASSARSAAFVLRSIIYPSTKAHEAMRTQSSNH
jgi:hypothetical protein